MANVIVNGETYNNIEELEVDKVGGGTQVFELPKNLQNKSVTITDNETVTYTADSGYDGLESLEVTTNVSGGGSSNPYEDIIDNQASAQKGLCLFAYCQDNDTAFANHFTSSVKSKIASLYGTFRNMTNLTTIDLTGIPAVNKKDFTQTFMGCTGLTTVGSTSDKSVDLTPLSTWTNITGTAQMFNGCTNLTSVDMSCLNSSIGTTRAERNSMFTNCTKLTNLILPYNTTYGKLISLRCDSMFSRCKLLTYIDLTHLDTEYAYSFYQMFGGQNSSNYCGVQTIDWGIDFKIPSFATIYQMFYYAKDLSVINYQGTKSEWKTNIAFWETLFNENNLRYDDTPEITVVCKDGIFNYQNYNSGDFAVIDTYTLQSATYSDGNTSYTFDTTNKQVTTNGNTYNYTITINDEIVVSDLGLTFTMTAGDSSWNATQLTDQNSNVYTILV